MQNFRKISSKRPILGHFRCSSSVSTVLGIETSCDDTAVAIVTTDRVIKAESKYNQWSVHKTLGKSKDKNMNTSFMGGIIPNVARLLHNENLIYAVSDCIKKVNNDWNNIDAIALTVKPGLEPCLWEGIQFTKLLLKKYKLPFIPIHHMEAHALTPRLFNRNLKFPYLTLLISGGHCIIALVENENKFYRYGESIDISPGNFIDKIARQLGLFHLNEECSSGGALLELFAKNGDPDSFPRIIKSVVTYCKQNKNCDVSFAGFLSTVSLLIAKLIREESQSIQVSGLDKKILKIKAIENICATVQKIIALQLEDRLKRALAFLYLRNITISDVVVSGGVASNLYIRSQLEDFCSSQGLKVSSPPISYCTDNGVMIAWNGCEKIIKDSADIIKSIDQDQEFFENLRPKGKCELGVDKSYQIKLLNIKI